jgi:hypothetical protein
VPILRPSNLPADTCAVDPATLPDLVVMDDRFLDTSRCDQLIQQTTHAPPICVLRYGIVNVFAGRMLRIRGSYAVALVAVRGMGIAGTVEAIANDPFFRYPGDGESTVQGGGGGAGSSTPGGNARFAAGGTPYGVPELVPLVPGSRGGDVIHDQLRLRGGHPGGALQLVSCGTLQVAGIVTAPGGGGQGNPIEGLAAGGGGGSGGGILIEAREAIIDGIIAANGGGGGAPNADDPTDLIHGEDGQPSAQRARGGVGINSPVTDGGAGGALAGPPGDSVGGGGGGAAGRIRINVPSGTVPTLGPGALISPAPTFGEVVLQP